MMKRKVEDSVGITSQPCMLDDGTRSVSRAVILIWNVVMLPDGYINLVLR